MKGKWINIVNQDINTDDLIKKIQHNYIDEEDVSLIHILAIKGDIENLEKTIKNGANINIESNNISPPLALYIKYNSKDKNFEENIYKLISLGAELKPEKYSNEFINYNDNNLITTCFNLINNIKENYTKTSIQDLNNNVSLQNKNQKSLEYLSKFRSDLDALNINLYNNDVIHNKLIDIISSTLNNIKQTIQKKDDYKLYNSILDNVQSFEKQVSKTIIEKDHQKNIPYLPWELLEKNQIEIIENMIKIYEYTEFIIKGEPPNQNIDDKLKKISIDNLTKNYQNLNNKQQNNFISYIKKELQNYMQVIDNNILNKEIEKLKSEHIEKKQNTQKVVEIFTRCNPNLLEKTNYLEILVNYTQNQQINSKKFTSKTTNAYYNIMNIIFTILKSFHQENKFKNFNFILNENKNMSHVQRLTLKTNKEQKMRRHF